MATVYFKKPDKYRGINKAIKVTEKDVEDKTLFSVDNRTAEYYEKKDICVIQEKGIIKNSRQAKIREKKVRDISGKKKDSKNEDNENYINEENLITLANKYKLKIDKNKDLQSLKDIVFKHVGLDVKKLSIEDVNEFIRLELKEKK